MTTKTEIRDELDAVYLELIALGCSDVMVSPTTCRVELRLDDVHMLLGLLQDQVSLGPRKCLREQAESTEWPQAALRDQQQQDRAEANALATEATAGLQWERVKRADRITTGLQASHAATCHGIDFQLVRCKNAHEAQRFMPHGTPDGSFHGYVVLGQDENLSRWAYCGLADNRQQATDEVRRAIIRVLRHELAQQHGYACDLRLGWK